MGPTPGQGTRSHLLQLKVHMLQVKVPHVVTKIEDLCATANTWCSQIEPISPASQADSLPAEPQGKAKNTGVSSLPLRQQIFPTQESNQGLLHCRQILYQLSYQGNPKMKVKVAQSCPTLCDLMYYTVHGVLQAKILEWVAFSLLQWIFPTKESNCDLLHCRWIVYPTELSGKPHSQIDKSIKVNIKKKKSTSVAPAPADGHGHLSKLQKPHFPKGWNNLWDLTRISMHI